MLLLFIFLNTNQQNFQFLMIDLKTYWYKINVVFYIIHIQDDSDSIMPDLYLLHFLLHKYSHQIFISDHLLFQILIHFNPEKFGEV